MSGGHIESIVCPECYSVEEAQVIHTRPFWTYIHDCSCGATITESEWKLSKEK